MALDGARALVFDTFGTAESRTPAAWMFLLEGLPSSLFGIALYLYLDDRPKDAKWLTPVEKEIVIHNLEADKKVADVSRHNRLGQTFSDPKIFLLAFVHFAITCGGIPDQFLDADHHQRIGRHRPPADWPVRDDPLWNCRDSDGFVGSPLRC